MTSTGEVKAGSNQQSQVPTLQVNGSWSTIVEGQERAALADVLPAYLKARRWFGGKARQIAGATITEAIRVPGTGEGAYISVVRVAYAEGDDQIYVLPLAFASGQQASRISEERAGAVICRLAGDAAAPEGILYDALVEPSFSKALLQLIAGQHHFRGSGGELWPSTTGAFQQIHDSATEPLEPRIVNAEQSNTSVIYDDRLIMKLFRRLEVGINPDLEIGRFLTDKANFRHVPPVTGAIEFRLGDGEPMSLAILQGFVPNRGDAWQYTLTTLNAYYRYVKGLPNTPPEEQPLSTPRLLDLAQQPLPPLANETVGTYLEEARLLGQRTAEMHLALASDANDPAFVPEPFTVEYQRSLHKAMTDSVRQGLNVLGSGVTGLPHDAQQTAQTLLAQEGAVLDRFHPLLEGTLTALRIRCHGDYHLGQVLYTGQDFFIIDFEGEPARSLSERRSKRSALQDVAGMLRSFHYASYSALFNHAPDSAVRPEDVSALEPWARAWHRWVSSTFVAGYLATAGQASFLPKSRDELQKLLSIYLLDKAVYEMVYELNNRPTWITIPLQGIMQLLATAG